MYEMVVVAFDKKFKAREVLDTLKQMSSREIIELKNAAVITRDASDKVEIKETHDFDTKKGALTGALAGSALGLLSGGLTIIGGAIIGAAGGAIASKATDLGLEDDFLQDIGDNLKPNSSAIVAMVDFEHVDRAMAELNKFEGGKILHHSLSEDVYSRLSDAVEDQPSV